MAEGHVALEPADHVSLVEVIADQAQAALRVEVVAVEGDDARRLLAAVLEGVQAQGGERRRVIMAEYAEDAALLAQPVAKAVAKAAV